MTFFLAVFTALFIADLLWWHRADRLLRGWPRGRASRAVVALFVGGALLTLLWIVFGGLFSDRPDEALPSSILAAAYIWHLVVLPASLITWLVISIMRGVAAIMRRSRARQSDTVPDAPPIREAANA